MRESPGNRPALLRIEHIKVAAGSMLALFGVRRLGRLVQISLHHPVALAVTAALGLGLWITPVGLLAASAALLAGLAGWKRTAPDSFAAHVGQRVRGARRTWLYRKKWRRALTHCQVIEEKASLPLLLWCKSSRTAGVDTLTVRMPDGHKVQRWADRADVLGPTFGAYVCQVKPVKNEPGKIARKLELGTHHSLPYKPHLVQVQMLHKDILAEPIPPPELDPEAPALPIDGWDLGLRGDSPTWEPEPFRYRLRAPLIIAGATQSGKTTLVRTLLRAMSPDIQRGLVRPVGINPKGDPTLGAAAHMFSDYTAGAIGGDITQFEEPAALLLEKYVKIMRMRAAELDMNAEEFTPSFKYPLLPIVMDDAALLVFYATNTKIRRRLRSSVAILASQGSGVGVIPVFLVQDPRVEIIQMRDLFTHRFALRGAGLVLHNNGELADEIPDDEKHQGYAYMEEAGRQTLTRWRVYNTTVRELRLCPPRPTLPPLVSEMELSPVAIA